MKSRVYVFIILLLGSCGSKKQYDVSTLSPAALEVYNDIKLTENEFKKEKKGIPVNYSKVDVIVNLSGIVPQNSVSGHYAQYKMEQNDLLLWMNWFEKNKHLISYYDNEDVIKYYYETKEKLIKVEYKPNMFMYSISEPELKRALEITEKIKKRRRNNTVSD